MARGAGPFFTSSARRAFVPIRRSAARISSRAGRRRFQGYGNFLFGVPFGFGLPFVIAAKNSTPTRTLALGLGFATGIELAQLLIGLLVFRSPYRIIDINDVLVVFFGTLFGYGLLRAVAYIYQWLGWAGGARLPVWDHFHAVLMNVASGGASRAAPMSREA